MSEPGSPLYHSTPSEVYSDVPTELIPPSERHLIHDYMSRRQLFLSDYERYNPIQNMNTLANHVFDLTENIHHLRNDFTGSRRLLDIVSHNQRDVNDSIKEVGQDLEHVGMDLGRVESQVKVHIERVESQVFEVKGDIERVESHVKGYTERVETQVRGHTERMESQVKGHTERMESQVKGQIGGLHRDIVFLQSEMQTIRQETQQGLRELKNMLTMIMGGRI